MLVRMRTIYASAHGNADPGRTIDLPREEAKELVKRGFAELADRHEEPEVATDEPEVETAVARGRRK